MGGWADGSPAGAASPAVAQAGTASPAVAQAGAASPVVVRVLRTERKRVRERERELLREG